MPLTQLVNGQLFPLKSMKRETKSTAVLQTSITSYVAFLGWCPNWCMICLYRESIGYWVSFLSMPQTLFFNLCEKLPLLFLSNPFSNSSVLRCLFSDIFSRLLFWPEKLAGEWPGEPAHLEAPLPSYHFCIPWGHSMGSSSFLDIFFPHARGCKQFRDVHNSGVSWSKLL